MQLELEEIKQIRKKYGLTQSDLAKMSGVSQSLIAKIEAGRIDPTFSNAQKIFAALTDMGKKHEINAGQLMTAKIISVKPSDDIKDAIKKMKNNSISQMPVIEEHKSIGIISEAIVLEAMLGNKGKKVEDIMGDAPPIVSKKTTGSVVSHLLKVIPMVIVSEEGKLVGVITKSDLLGKMYKG
ncbi:CBS domain-containing protein [Candidatus Woesearchaeota archaeon]|nr:CBS domain-containing protein [Candidatus Woesearchaeota archaeon]